MKKIIFLILLANTATAQKNISVTGTVSRIDNTHEELVSVGLLRQPDSVIIKGTITDAAGKFIFSNIKAGIYFLSISKTGYSKTYSQVFSVDSLHESVVKDIIIKPAVTSLTEIIVRSQKPFIEKRIDKLVVNIENSILSTGNTSLEVLEKLPGLAVTPDGSVTMKNKSVAIYVNGRATELTGSDLAVFLTGLNAEQIQKIELIEHPSSKYDAAGTGGIVNIVLKKDQKKGLNGNSNMSFSQGNYSRYLAGVNLNYRNKKINVYGGLNYNHIRDKSDYSSIRNFKTGSGSASRFEQSGFSPSKAISGLVRAGIDYSLSGKTVIGLLATGSLNNNSSNNVNVTNIKNGSGITDSIIQSINNGKSRWQTGNINFNLKHTFDSTGREISIDANYIDYERSDSRFYRDVYLDNAGVFLHTPDTLVNNYPGKLLIKTFKADYTHPVNSKMVLEAGLKASLVKNSNNLLFFNKINGAEVINTVLSNNFIYSENIYAFYINASREYKHFSVQLGFRGEQTNSRSYQVTTMQDIRRNYFKLFPSVFFNYNVNDNNQFGFTYSGRINRPSYQRLNPYKKIYDPLNYEQGNPYLDAVFSNEIEINYSYRNKLFLACAYSYENKTATNIILQDEITKTTITTFGNLAKAQGGALVATYNNNFTKWFSSNNFAGLFFNRFQGPYLNGYLDIFKPSFNFNSTNSFTISKSIRAELGLNYLSSQQQGLLDIDNIGFQVNMGIQKAIMKQTGTVKISVIDLFDQRKWNYSTVFQDIDTRYLSSWDNRRVTLSFNYKFGKQTVKQERRRRTGSEEEKARVEL